MDHDRWLPQLRAELTKAHGDRFRGLVLYGSEARGDAEPDSDIDLLVLLDGPISLGADIDRSVDAVYPIMLALERPIHALPADAEAYAAGSCALFRRVRAEGVLL